MDCEKFEELLIDFIGNNLSPSEMKTVRKHLLVCPDCAREVEDYKQIKQMLKREDPPELSPKLLKELAKRAQREAGVAEKPFWKRWFYSPVLVPAMSFTIALFLWSSYGEDAFRLLRLRDDISSTSLMARKISPSVERDSPSEKSEESVSIEAESPTDAPASPPSSNFEPEFEAEALAPAPLEKSPVRIEPQPRAEVAAMNASEARTSAENQLASGEIFEPAEADKAPESAAEPQAESVEAKFQLALRLQREGVCEESVKISQDLLRMSPPDDIKEQIYLSLAECYEVMRNWDMAIANYNNLQRVAPRRSGFAQGKIGAITAVKANASR